MKESNVDLVLQMGNHITRKGELARLFPVLSENSKEGRAASILLATLMAIPKFADVILRPFGRSVGTTSRISCFTEIDFKGAQGDRPDGLIGVITGKKIWRAFVEFKVGSSLTVGQVEKYLKLARDIGIDAVVTISNDIVSDVSQSPVRVNGQLTRSVQLFHISWMQIRTHAEMLLASKSVEDLEQQLLLREFIRFLDHKSTGIKGFVQMPAVWSDIVTKSGARNALRKTGEAEKQIANAWQQEERELSFILSQLTHVPCEIKRTRVEKRDPQAIEKKHLKYMCETGTLTTELLVKDAPAPIDVCVDLVSRSLRFSIKLQAPLDVTKPQTRLRWLLKQLPADLNQCEVKTHWSGKKADQHDSIEKIRADNESILKDSKEVELRYFSVERSIKLGKVFNSRKRFISEIENSIQRFYSDVVQHLQAWHPKAATSKPQTISEDISEESTFSSD